jgi:hypothetical protein
LASTGFGVAEALVAQPDEIERAGDLQQREGFGTRQHQRGDADGAGRDMDEPAEPGAEARCQAFVAAARERTGGDAEQARPRRYRNCQCRREEEAKFAISMRAYASGSGSPGGSGTSKTLSVMETSM